MVTIRSSNRLLTKIEVDSDLNGLGYESDVLKSVLEKYGYTSSTTGSSEHLKWKKNQMDEFREKIARERKDLDDLFEIYVTRNRKIFETKFQLEMSTQLYVSKERYYSLQLKVDRLRKIVYLIQTKIAKLASKKFL